MRAGACGRRTMQGVEDLEQPVGTNTPQVDGLHGAADAAARSPATTDPEQLKGGKRRFRSGTCQVGCIP
jgi:hypothetical protein